MSMFYLKKHLKFLILGIFEQSNKSCLFIFCYFFIQGISSDKEIRENLNSELVVRESIKHSC